MFEVTIEDDHEFTHHGAVEWAKHIHKFKGAYSFDYYGLTYGYKWKFESSEDALIFKLKFA